MSPAPGGWCGAWGCVLLPVEGVGVGGGFSGVGDVDFVVCVGLGDVYFDEWFRFGCGGFFLFLFGFGVCFFTEVFVDGFVVFFESGGWVDVSVVGYVGYLEPSGDDPFCGDGVEFGFGFGGGDVVVGVCFGDGDVESACAEGGFGFGRAAVSSEGAGVFEEVVCVVVFPESSAESVDDGFECFGVVDGVDVEVSDGVEDSAVDFVVGEGDEFGVVLDVVVGGGGTVCSQFLHASAFGVVVEAVVGVEDDVGGQVEDDFEGAGCGSHGHWCLSGYGLDEVGVDVGGGRVFVAVGGVVDLVVHGGVCTYMSVGRGFR